MHKLLARQLRRCFGSEDAVPEPIRPFVSAVDDAYRQADEDRELLEHSMDTVSEELVERYEQLQQALTDSEEAAAELRMALSLVEATIEATADGILVVDNSGRIVRTNDRFVQLWGLPEDVLAAGDDNEALVWVSDQLEDPDEFLARVRELYADPAAESFDTIRFKDGRIIERYSQPQEIGGVTAGRVWSFRDITERRELEERLWQSQKMEAVGNLAGGIAHDFNNLLTVIQFHTVELQRDGTLTPEARESVNEVHAAAIRAADLTGQLLAFSRKQILRPVALDLNRIVREVEPMLRRLVREDIEIHTSLAEPIGPVEADPGQLGQVLMNLAVNARDAMPGGGRLSISTAEIEHVAPAEGARAPMESGRYSVMTVADTGGGVPPEVRDRIFDPFFTTKDAGKGTGLGLATTYGIVKQSGGFIFLEDGPPADAESGRCNADESESEDRGATFSVYLPVTNRVPESSDDEPAASRATGGTETILLAEDEVAVRRVIRRLLERYGYEVLVAQSGRDAARIAAERGAEVDLVLTDLVMPDLSGRDLADLIRSRRPDARVLFMSGHTDDEILRRGVEHEGTPFIQKPFLGSDLPDAVRRALDG